MIFRFAWRYFSAKKSTNAINVIAWVSVVAITVGTACLLIILSAFNGFETLVRSLYSSFYPDIRISPAKGSSLFLTPEQLKRIRQTGGVGAASLVMEGKALLQNGEFQTVVTIKGVDEYYPYVSGVPEHMVRGRFETGNEEMPGIVMGIGIENAVGVLADRTLAPLTIYLSRKGVEDASDPLAALAVGTVRAAGTFAIQQEFDNGYVLTNLPFLKQHMGWDVHEYSAVEIRLSGDASPESVQKSLQQLLGPEVQVQDRMQQNRSLYATIRLEKWVIYGIFSLILLVAAFTMVGALTMLVLEKKKDIYILRALGADPLLIRRIFVSEGLLLAGIGALFGMLLAVVLYYLQITYKLVPLEGQSFLIDYYPVKLVAGDFVLVGLTVGLIGVMASCFPASRASRL